MLNKTLVRATLAAAAFAACGAAFAQQGLYVGGVLSRLDYKESGFPTYNPSALAVSLGTEFTPNLAAEVRLGTGVSSASKTVSGLNTKLEVTSYVGVYGKGSLPLSSVASVYGLIGYTSAKFKASVGGASATGSDGSFSFGVGADFGLSKTTSIGVEWASLVRADSYDLNALSLTAKYRF
ncbi:MAG: porin family protein [Burkholderiales bacterium]